MKKTVIVGLTGQSGAGKTLVSHVFEENEFAVINCDLVSRQVTFDGSDCCKELSKEFPECFDQNLSLDRRAMAKIVFSDSKKLRRLNEIIFPHIKREIEKKTNEYTDIGSEYILLDAPTLFESGTDEMCDVIISCISDREKRLARIIERDGISRQLAESRLDSQLSEEYFKERSDYIIENNGSAEQLMTNAQNVAERIKGV